MSGTRSPPGISDAGRSHERSGSLQRRRPNPDAIAPIAGAQARGNVRAAPQSRVRRISQTALTLSQPETRFPNFEPRTEFGVPDPEPRANALPATSANSPDPPQA